MRKLVYYVASSIDGFIAAPDGAFDFFAFSPDLAEFIHEAYPETLPTPYRQQVGLDVPAAAFDTVLMGRGTYGPGLAAGLTDPYAHLTTYVFSRTLTGDHVISEDPVAFVRELKRADGRDIWLCGGGDLAGQLAAEVDELVIKLNPVVLGAGVPLFGREFAVDAFELVEARPLSAGVVVLRYRRPSPAV